MPSSPAEARALLLKMFEAAVSAAHPAPCVPPHLPPVPAGGRIIIVGAGKAQATERHYKALGQADRISGFVTS